MHSSALFVEWYLLKPGSVPGNTCQVKHAHAKNRPSSPVPVQNMHSLIVTAAFTSAAFFLVLPALEPVPDRASSLPVLVGVGLIIVSVISDPANNV